MGKKSDKRIRERRISATEASRSFSRILDEVEAGRRFLIHRHGRDVCVVAPPPVPARRASECLAVLRGRSAVLLDDRFGADLLEVLATEPVEERPSWDS
jgi:antitoxin (DNA-binding transcriptional repressor) of toxin-antitoxin stability system